MAFYILLQPTRAYIIEPLVRTIIDTSANRIEIFPIPATTPVSLGLSIPLSEIDQELFQILKTILTDCITQHKFQVFELYSGNEIKIEDFDKLRQLMIAE